MSIEAALGPNFERSLMRQFQTRDEIQQSPQFCGPSKTDMQRAYILKNGKNIIIRKYNDNDYDRFRKFHSLLTDKTIIQRYGWILPLEQRLSVKDNQEIMLFVVEEIGANAIVGECLLATVKEEPAAIEGAMMASEEYQNSGIGFCMKQYLKEVAVLSGFNNLCSLHRGKERNLKLR